jgi:hypothetical protein
MLFDTEGVVASHRETEPVSIRFKPLLSHVKDAIERLGQL